jgi:hypothetical protein
MEEQMASGASDLEEIVTDILTSKAHLANLQRYMLDISGGPGAVPHS